ncbi:MAG: nicotinamide mononucleotide deamidase-related protein [Nitrososphaerota archaeon]|nr:nicotinamide mononucleotide deamidase-related protein [Candidatus Bathyarchaeota archaeon]MDW8024135.1 nicotinamide mononucleotide deamidase-related protein [Nitrososphaerota archaeon]
MSMQMEIVCVGNELLIGKTLNTNAQWLSKRATSLGVTVKRITVVGDDVEEIASAIREAVQRKPRFIITTGGLGPTFDDKTLEGIARALNRKLILNDKALKMVKEKYEAYAEAGKIDEFEMTPHRVKMATLPEGAEPIPNPIGTAPGVLLKVDGVYLVALPGVPSEMEAIFEESLAALLRKEAGDTMFFEASIYADSIMESTLAPLIDTVMRSNPYVYIKSHPKAEEKKPHIEIHLSTTAKDSETAKNRLGKAIIQLSELIKEKGGKVKV